MEADFGMAGADTRPLTLGEWMITLLVLWIPLVNIIMYVVWAISDTGNVNRKRFCQASILWFLIVVAFGVGFGILFTGLALVSTGF